MLRYCHRTYFFSRDKNVKPLLTQDKWLNPIWLPRLLSTCAALLVGAAQWVLHPGNMQALCLGAALGLLVALTAFFWSSVDAVVLKNRPQPSDVAQNSIRP